MTNEVKNFVNYLKFSSSKGGGFEPGATFVKFPSTIMLKEGVYVASE